MKILIIGETCRDKFIYGSVNRLCPEAPVPVFQKQRLFEAIGMAGNVKRNLIACAEDLEEEIEVDIITNNIYGSKSRYIDIVSNQMFIRVDSDGYQSISKNKLSKIKFDKYDAVIVSDYNKGFLDDEDLVYIAKKAKISFLDTKKKYNFKWAELFNFIKINEKEFKENNFEQNYESCKSNTIITLGARGCSFKGNNYHLKSTSQVRDVTGAGDTFLAAFSLYYLTTQDIELAIAYAQRCCKIVISKSGTATI